MLKAFLAKLLLNALYLVSSITAISKIRFGHFMGRSLKSPSLSIFIDGKNESVKVNSLNVTDYHTYDCYNPNFTIKIQNGATFYYQVPTNETSYRRTVYFSWSNGPVTNWLEDLMDPKAVFRNMSLQYPDNRPYHNNSLVRIVMIDPQDRTLSFLVKENMEDNTTFRKLKPSGFGDYLLESSYVPKTYKIESGSGSALEEKEFKKIETFKLHGIYTVFWYGDSISESNYEVAIDIPEDSTLPPLIFLVTYLLTWAVFRKLYLKLQLQRAKKNFYVPKTIRVQSASEKEQLLTAEEVPYIDTFRGLAIILFIFVKSGGGNYWFLNETLWNGLSIGDLPKFMISWIMGFCIPLNLVKIKGESKWKIIQILILKSFIVCTLGNFYLLKV